MCSGCSGHYDGDFDGPAEPTGDCGALVPDASGTTGKLFGTEIGGSFEATPDSMPSASRASPRSRSAPEICEIVVSAARIVEIRVVTANFANVESDEMLSTRISATPVARQQSMAALAKYYQTRGSDPESRNHRAKIGRFRRPAIDALGGLKRLLQRAQRAFGNHTSRISE